VDLEPPGKRIFRFSLDVAAVFYASLATRTIREFREKKLPFSLK